MSDKRRDSKGRLLKQGERQREDGKYEYRYYDEKGGRHSVYSWRLVDTDRIPPGKRDAESLRSMEKRIRRDPFQSLCGGVYLRYDFKIYARISDFQPGK